MPKNRCKSDQENLKDRDPYYFKAWINTEEFPPTSGKPKPWEEPLHPASLTLFFYPFAHSLFALNPKVSPPLSSLNKDAVSDRSPPKRIPHAHTTISSTYLHFLFYYDETDNWCSQARPSPSVHLGATPLTTQGHTSEISVLSVLRFEVFHIIKWFSLANKHAVIIPIVKTKSQMKQEDLLLIHSSASQALLCPALE